MSEEIVEKWVSVHEFRHLGVEIEIDSTLTGKPPYNKITKFFYNDKNLTEKDIDGILWKLGLDTINHRYTLEDPALHPTDKHGLKVDFRFTAPERTDKAWLESGKASEEVLIKMSRMKGLGEELKKLSKRLTSSMYSSQEENNKKNNN